MLRTRSPASPTRPQTALDATEHSIWETLYNHALDQSLNGESYRYVFEISRQVGSDELSSPEGWTNIVKHGSAWVLMEALKDTITKKAPDNHWMKKWFQTNCEKV